MDYEEAAHIIVEKLQEYHDTHAAPLKMRFFYPYVIGPAKRLKLTSGELVKRMIGDGKIHQFITYKGTRYIATAKYLEERDFEYCQSLVDLLQDNPNHLSQSFELLKKKPEQPFEL